MATVLTYYGVIPDAGFLDFDESLDSCITDTLTFFLSNDTPSSVSLFPILLALNCDSVRTHTVTQSNKSYTYNLYSQ